MKVSLKWLREYVDIAVPVEELAERLNLSGTEVAAVEERGSGWDNVLVGRVTRVEPHPNADRLKLVTVDLGGDSQRVVCGAPNVAEGQKVAFARPGATLIDGHTGEPTVLRAARIRGVESAGMVCSEKELGLSDDHSGILVLEEVAPVGAPLADVLGDTVLDLSITPNRPDCLSVIGVAREVAAVLGTAVRLPSSDYEETGPPIGELASVEIEDAGLCPRYIATVVQEVKVGPSPPWMQQRLLASGMRPINNLVDITNYVMLEYGQPLHAFDYDELADHRIVVRTARAGERLTTLDGAARPLSEGMLLICDGLGPVAVAGVMGGASSEVSEATTTVLLESANFDRTSLRRTSVALRLRTEASQRFDKGLSRELPLVAVRRATRLMKELAGGRVARGLLDVYPGRQSREPVKLTRRRLHQVLGVPVGMERARQVLESLGFACEPGSGPAEELSVTVPYWRTDVTIPDDLVEEVGRIVGYEDMPATIPAGRLPRVDPSPGQRLQEDVRDLLAACGLQEVITYSLISRALEASTRRPGAPEAPEPLRVANPMTLEHEVLRTSLRPGVLATVAANSKHTPDALQLFEVGRVFHRRPGDLPEEKTMAVAVLAGRTEEPSWLGSAPATDFFQAKGIVETVLARLGIRADYLASDDQTFLPGRAAEIVAGGERVGVVGELHPDLVEAFDIVTRPVGLLELDLGVLLRHVERRRHYQPIPRYPPVSQDLALIVDRRVPSASVQAIIESSDMVAEARLFDDYSGPPVPPGKRSLAYAIAYQAPDRTLTDEEVAQAQAEIVRRLERELGAQLRA